MKTTLHTRSQSITATHSTVTHSTTTTMPYYYQNRPVVQTWQIIVAIIVPFAVLVFCLALCQCSRLRNQHHVSRIATSNNWLKLYLTTGRTEHRNEQSYAHTRNRNGNILTRLQQLEHQTIEGHNQLEHHPGRDKKTSNSA